jgi:hypothetical protein
LEPCQASLSMALEIVLAGTYRIDLSEPRAT